MHNVKLPAQAGMNTCARCTGTGFRHDDEANNGFRYLACRCGSSCDPNADTDSCPCWVECGECDGSGELEVA